jgi:putative copper resistance protein D
LDDPLIWVRALHFASTMAVAGAIFFLGYVAEPCFGAVNDHDRLASLIRSRLAVITWAALALAVLTGLAWLVLLAARMGDDVPLIDVVSEGVLGTVLAATDFGWDWILRLILAGLLAGTLVWQQRSISSDRAGTAVIVLAAGLVGTLAWAGHAAANSGVQGSVHLFADVLHLLAAAAWIGALIPLAVLLRTVRAHGDGGAVMVARGAVLRFSTLGVASVGTLVVTGAVNSWMLVGSLSGLIRTGYGQLLSVKLGLFVLMLSIAAVNRLWLTPRVIGELKAPDSRRSLGHIERNTLIEVSVGALIIFIVAVLGTMPPGVAE